MYRYVLTLVAGLLVAGSAMSRADTPAINRFELHDTPVAGGAAITTAAIPCRDRGWPSTALRVTIGLSGADSTVAVRVAQVDGTPATEYDLLLSGGAPLNAGNLYTFSFGISSSF